MVEAAAVTAGALETLTAKDYIKTDLITRAEVALSLHYSQLMSDLNAIKHLPLNMHCTGELGCVPTC